jgi:hypothetical protein
VLDSLPRGLYLHSFRDKDKHARLKSIEMECEDYDKRQINITNALSGREKLVESVKDLVDSIESCGIMDIVDDGLAGAVRKVNDTCTISAVRDQMTTPYNTPRPLIDLSSVREQSKAPVLLKVPTNSISPIANNPTSSQPPLIVKLAPIFSLSTALQTPSRSKLSLGQVVSQSIVPVSKAPALPLTRGMGRVTSHFTSSKVPLVSAAPVLSLMPMQAQSTDPEPVPYSQQTLTVGGVTSVATAPRGYLKLNLSSAKV